MAATGRLLSDGAHYSIVRHAAQLPLDDTGQKKALLKN